SALDIAVSQKGLLIPRMTTSDRNSISAPADALQICNTTSRCFEAYSSASGKWVTMSCLDCQLPGYFSASSASGVQDTQFIAHWTTSPGASDYYLDVTTDAQFTALVSGYDDLSVGNVSTYLV